MHTNRQIEIWKDGLIDKFMNTRRDGRTHDGQIDKWTKLLKDR